MTPIKQRSSYAAAAHVLRTPSLHWIVDGKINDETQTIVWEDIHSYYNSMSSGEQALFNIALAIARDRGDVQLDMGAYDEACWERVIEALLALRPLPSVHPATEIADKAIGMFISRLDSAGVYLCASTGMGEYHTAEDEDVQEVRAEVVQEIREGMAVRDEDIR